MPDQHNRLVRLPHLKDVRRLAPERPALRAVVVVFFVAASLAPAVQLLNVRPAAAASLGRLRVMSSPAVPTQIRVDGHIADSWGLAWLQLSAGTHTVSFSHVTGYSEPGPQTVTVTASNTTTLVGNFAPRGTLRVTTSPSVASQITIDSNPADDSGVWTDLAPGTHQVCFGAVAGYTPPPCQTTTLTAGNETDITGTFTANPAAPGQTGVGTLRVTTNPALPSQIILTPQGGSPYTTDTWGLNWLALAPGTYTVAFSHVAGYSEPAPQTISVTAGTTTTVTGTFSARGTLRVTTSPALDATITLDNNPADDWGLWTDLPIGTYQVCFGAVAGYTPPPCQTATLTANTETDVIGVSTGPFTAVCGTQLCQAGQPFVIKGATAYGQYDNATNEVALAKQAGVNLLELVEFDQQYHVLSDTESAATWQRVDQFIAAAKAGGLHVILNLSEYGQSLIAAGQTATAVDWGPYLSFIASRINTVTGVRYSADPTIAMMELYGEIDAPNYNKPGAGTTAQMNAFFARSLAEWKSLAPSILGSSGGFSYINDPNSGIDWKTIMADSNDSTCDVEVNSYADRNISVPEVVNYCSQLGKPWFLSAWSSCYKSRWGADDINDWSSDAQMATHAQDMYTLAKTNQALGNDFWNLANKPLKFGVCDIGQQFPLTLSTVTAN